MITYLNPQSFSDLISMVGLSVALKNSLENLIAIRKRNS